MNHRIRTFRTMIGVSLVCLFIPVLAQGQSNEEKMNASVDAAMAAEAHYAAKDYLKAVQSYRTAYGLFPQPKFLQKVAKSYEKAAKIDRVHCPDAERAWRHFLRVCGDCDKKPLALRKVDDVSRWCAKGALTQVPTLGGKVSSKSTVAVVMKVPVKKSSWAVYTLGGAGLAVALAGVGFHLSAAATAADISRSDLEVYQNDVDVVESRERMAWASYGIGAALLTTAAFLINGDTSDAVSFGRGGVTHWVWSF